MEYETVKSMYDFLKHQPQEAKIALSKEFALSRIAFKGADIQSKYHADEFSQWNNINFPHDNQIIATTTIGDLCHILSKFIETNGDSTVTINLNLFNKATMSFKFSTNSVPWYQTHLNPYRQDTKVEEELNKLVEIVGSDKDIISRWIEKKTKTTVYQIGQKYYIGVTGLAKSYPAIKLSEEKAQTEILNQLFQATSNPQIFESKLTEVQFQTLFGPKDSASLDKQLKALLIK